MNVCSKLVCPFLHPDSISRVFLANNIMICCTWKMDKQFTFSSCLPRDNLYVNGCSKLTMFCTTLALENLPRKDFDKKRMVYIRNTTRQILLDRISGVFFCCFSCKKILFSFFENHSKTYQAG